MKDPRSKTPIGKLIAPVNHFIHLEYTSGLVLLGSVVIAILWANILPAGYHHFWELKLAVGLDKYVLNQPLHIWINDGLMAIFFFVIGLELKRAFIDGALSTVRQAALPMSAALGGMLVPAGIYLLFNQGTAASHGWGIPMATDIAFALALLSMIGKHIPLSLKVFLSALAVADDLGAILVIAVFYTAEINLLALGAGLAFVLVLIAGNKMGIRANAFYLVVGIAVWLAFLISGVHATIAGVLVAFTIPAKTLIDEKIYARSLRKLSDEFESEIPNNSTLTTERQHDIITEVKILSTSAETPLQKIENALHPFVAFIIMPLFALANAGIIIESDFFSRLINPVSMGVAVGLVIGKLIGVLLFTWLMVKTGLSVLPDGTRWREMTGVALLAGIGFTMSLFISGLAFSDAEMINEAKYGILVASVVAGLLGAIVLRKRNGKTVRAGIADAK